MLENYNMDVESYIDRALKFSELIRIKKEFNEKIIHELRNK